MKGTGSMYITQEGVTVDAWKNIDEDENCPEWVWSFMGDAEEGDYLIYFNGRIYVIASELFELIFEELEFEECTTYTLDDETSKRLDWMTKNKASVSDYINHFYIPKPIYTDSEAISVNDSVIRNDLNYHRIIEDFVVHADGSSIVYYKGGGMDSLDSGEALQRDADSQLIIDKDSLMEPEAYCLKYGLDTAKVSAVNVMVGDLLKRQRKLNGIVS